MSKSLREEFRQSLGQCILDVEWENRLHRNWRNTTTRAVVACQTMIDEDPRGNLILGRNFIRSTGFLRSDSITEDQGVVVLYEEINTMEVPSLPSKLYHATCMINNIQVAALVDSGAYISFLSHKFVKENNIPYESPPRGSTYLRGGKIDMPVGRAKVNLKWGEKE